MVSGRGTLQWLGIRIKYTKGSNQQTSSHQRLIGAQLPCALEYYRTSQLRGCVPFRAPPPVSTNSLPVPASLAPCALSSTSSSSSFSTQTYLFPPYSPHHDDEPQSKPHQQVSIRTRVWRWWCTISLACSHSRQAWSFALSSKEHGAKHVRLSK